LVTYLESCLEKNRKKLLRVVKVEKYTKPWRECRRCWKILNAGHVIYEITACWSTDYVVDQSDARNYFRIFEFYLLWKFFLCCGESIVFPIHWSLSVFMYSLVQLDFWVPVLSPSISETRMLWKILIYQLAVLIDLSYDYYYFLFKLLWEEVKFAMCTSE